jgi:hypothetical protein
MDKGTGEASAGTSFLDVKNLSEMNFFSAAKVRTKNGRVGGGERRKYFSEFPR